LNYKVVGLALFSFLVWTSYIYYYCSATNCLIVYALGLDD